MAFIVDGESNPKHVIVSGASWLWESNGHPKTVVYGTPPFGTSGNACVWRLWPRTLNITSIYGYNHNTYDLTVSSCEIESSASGEPTGVAGANYYMELAGDIKPLQADLSFSTSSPRTRVIAYSSMTVVGLPSEYTFSEIFIPDLAFDVIIRSKTTYQDVDIVSITFHADITGSRLRLYSSKSLYDLTGYSSDDYWARLRYGNLHIQRSPSRDAGGLMHGPYIRFQRSLPT